MKTLVRLEAKVLLVGILIWFVAVLGLPVQSPELSRGRLALRDNSAGLINYSFEQMLRDPLSRGYTTRSMQTVRVASVAPREVILIGQQQVVSNNKLIYDSFNQGF